MWPALCVLVACVLGAQEYAGLEVIVHQSLLNEVNALVPQYLNQLLKLIKIPDIQGETHITGLGNLDYSVTDIQIPELNLRSSTTDITSEGIKEAVVGNVIKTTCNYFWKKEDGIKASDHGTLDITIEGTQFAFVLDIGESNGRPTVHTPEVYFSMGKLDLEFHGKVAWIYNTLDGIFKPIIEKAINKQVPGQIANAVNKQAEEALAKLQIIVPWKTVDMNFTMMGPPHYAPNLSNFAFQLSGMFEDRQTRTACPLPSYPLPGSQTNGMLEAYYGQFVADCAALVFYKQGLLKRLITPADLPKNSSFQLNTTDFKLFLPALYRAYPNDAVDILVYAAAPPTLNLTTAGAAFDVAVGLEIMAVLPNRTAVPAVTFSVGVSGSVILSLNETHNGTEITGRLSPLNCNITLVSSEVGHVDVALFSLAVAAGCRGPIPAFVNAEYLGKGIALPSVHGFSLTDSALFYGNGFAGISASIKPPRPA